MPCTAVCLAGYQVITGVMRSGFTIPRDRRLSVCPPPWRTNVMFGLSHCLSHRRVVIVIARRVFILTCESYERTLVMAARCASGGIICRLCRRDTDNRAITVVDGEGGGEAVDRLIIVVGVRLRRRRSLA